jgi:hypothetical protein
MRYFMYGLWFWASLAGAASGRALLNFDKGEITPVLAQAVEKSGPQQYTLRLPASFSKAAVERVRVQLEKELQGFAGLTIDSREQQLLIRYQGPDTPLLQALSTIRIEEK